MRPMLLGDVAHRLDLTRHGARYLVLRGVLRPCARTPSGLPIYDEDEVDRLAEQRQARRRAARSGQEDAA